MRKSAVTAITLALVTGGGALSAPAAGATTTTGELTIYVKPTSAQTDRAHSGLTAGDAVASFDEAQRILRDRGVRHARILVPGGTYRPGKQIDWTYAPAGGSVTIAPAPGTGKVVFDGSRAAAAGYFMTLTARNSDTTVRGLEIQRYANGIYVRGTANDRVTGVTITGNRFQKLGTKHSGSGRGFAGVHIVNASRVKVTGNRFYSIENDPLPGNMHGVYLGTSAKSTTISGNRFGYVSGDPIRTRNGSDNNTASGNKFWRAGTYAVFSDWRYGTEACGKGNVFKDNQVGRTSYYGKKFGSGKQGRTDPITIKVLLWGHDATRSANLGGCGQAPVKSGGGNKFVDSRPW
ncbi:right-handed parallel beta-helix repeat-containing protein [Streptomyces sp. NPDC046862]|uniref:right-handed parallel beta-helix repeat-containing protein n=1 Tax=Streptomyces sp. NPDC046862 TaxID=3154603 RepID=UPI003456E9BE